MLNINPDTSALILRMKELDIISTFNSNRAFQTFEQSQSKIPRYHDIIWEILIASDRCFMMDAEDGRIPPDYKSLIEAIIHQFEPELTSFEVRFDYKVIGRVLSDVRITLIESGKETTQSLEDFGDYYDYHGVKKLLNETFNRKSDFKIFNIETNDQSFCFVKLDSNKMAALYSSLKMNWDDDYISQISMDMWQADIPDSDLYNDQERLPTSRDLLKRLNHDLDLDEELLMELCQKYKNSKIQNLEKFYEGVFLSRFLGASMEAKQILLHDYNYSTRKIYDILMDALFDAKKIHNIRTFIHHIYSWPNGMLPASTRIFSIFTTMEKKKFDGLQIPMEWAILILGYRNKKHYSELLNILNLSKNSVVKKICIDVLSLITFIHSYSFVGLKRNKIDKTFQKLILEKGYIYASNTIPYYEALSSIKSPKHLIKIFKKIHTKMDTLSKISFIKIINRSLHTKSYHSSVEPIYMEIWEKHSDYENYLIKGLVLSSNPKVIQKLAPLKNSNDSKIKEALSYSKNKALQEMTEFQEGMNGIRNIVLKK